MRLALVVTGGLHPSGREQVMPSWLWLIEQLALAHNVHAFVLRHLPQATRYTLAGATIHDLGRPEGRWRQLRALRRALYEAGPFDVVHGFWVDPGGLAAAIAGRWLGIPSVVTCNSGEFSALPDIDYGLQRIWRGRALVSATCRLATRVHVATKHMETLANTCGYSAIRIPIGVDLQSVAGPIAREDGPPWRLLQVASLNRVKDQATLLDAIAIARRCVDVRLDLVGEDTLVGRLQRHAKDLGIDDSVTFHGFVPNDALGPLLHAAHLYVQSSRHEAAGVAVLEAAAAGLPIVGTRTGYVSDWASSATAAVPPADPRAMAAVILEVLANPGHRRRMAEQARRFVVAHDVEWTTAQLTALYEALRRDCRGITSGEAAGQAPASGGS